MGIGIEIGLAWLRIFESIIPLGWLSKRKIPSGGSAGGRCEACIGHDLAMQSANAGSWIDTKQLMSRLNRCQWTVTRWWSVLSTNAVSYITLASS